MPIVRISIRCKYMMARQRLLPGAKGRDAMLPRTNSCVPSAACGRRSRVDSCNHTREEMLSMHMTLT